VNGGSVVYLPLEYGQIFINPKEKKIEEIVSHHVC
jgi:hypothetical protein